MKKTLVVILSLVLILSLFVGCGQKNDVAEKQAEVAEQSGDVTNEAGIPKGIQQGTVANTYISMDFVTQQFPGQEPPAAWMYGLVYETLFYAPDGDYDNMQGLLAKDWTVSQDGLTWVINLEENVYFANGNKFNAASVVGTYDFTRQYQPAVFRQIDSYEVTGEYQVTFNLNSPMPEFMRQFAINHMGIMDHTAIEGIKEPSVENAYGIGTAPYYISDYKTGDYITFTANENYWNKDRMAHIETIQCKVILDPTTGVSTLQTGEMDVAPITDFNSYEILSMSENVVILEGPGANQPYYFNAALDRANLLENVNVRKALTMMVDMEQVVIAATDVYGKVYSNAFNDAVVYEDGYAYDPDGAIAILEAEGFTPEDIKLEAVVDMESSNAFSNIQAQLAGQGVELSYTVQDKPAANTAGIKGEWDIWASSGGMTAYDFISPLTMLLGETAMFNVFNDAAVEPEIWELVAKAASATSYEDEKEYIEEIARVLGENYAYLGNIKVQNWAAFSTRIGNPVIDENLGLWLPWYSYIVE